MAPDPILDDLTIDGFFDAAALAIELHDLFGRYATAVALASDGAVVDLTVFTEEHAEVDAALDWAHCLVVHDHRVERLLLLSSTTADLEILAEQDLADYRHAREVFGTWDVEVVDWLQTDGDTVRSMGSSGVGGWAGDPNR